MGLLLVSLVAIVLVLSYLKFQKCLTTINTIDYNTINNGDVVLRCGRSVESYAVYLTDNKTEYTHIGIIKIENSKPFVIHVVPSKSNLVLKEELATFLNSKNASRFTIYRPSLNPQILAKVTAEAQRFYLLKYAFDNEYDLNTNQKLYCTELVLKAFQNAGVHLKLNSKEFNYGLGKQSIIFPSEIAHSPFFNKLIY